jgi:hypothetical protein
VIGIEEIFDLKFTGHSGKMRPVRKGSVHDDEDDD